MTPAADAGPGCDQVRLAVLQATSLCNLNCRYCYVPDRRDAARMPWHVLEAAARFVFAAAPDQRSFRFLWHAGEPLAAGLPFYQRAFAVIEGLAPAGSSVTHSIQTNGTLISESWCRLFEAHCVQIGLSIDGPADVHDANRRTWSNRGSHAQVMRGCGLLREHGIDPAALCVLTPLSFAKADDLYDFFVGAGFTSVAFNVDEAEGANATSSLSRAAPETILAGYKEFMRRLWRRWRADSGRLRIREFQQELSCIHDLQVDSTFVREPDEVVPFGILTVRRDGGVSTFAPELASTSSPQYADFVVGNVLRDSPAEVRAGASLRRLSEDVARGRLACQRSCPYYAMCGAGFQSNRIAEHGSLAATETWTCRLHRQSLLDVIVEELSGNRPAPVRG
jgi:uncharacterized protein